MSLRTMEKGKRKRLLCISFAGLADAGRIQFGRPLTEGGGDYYPLNSVRISSAGAQKWA
jgi:hypothetical protein